MKPVTNTKQPEINPNIKHIKRNQMSDDKYIDYLENRIKELENKIKKDENKTTEVPESYSTESTKILLNE